ncbi:NAD(P)-dependent alcohol dehydrogenase [Agromyces sp. SYSU T00194]|uniref:NAD(P)-dependent alcohol dehydrogenase n=1 Tax=Agromyces chitinivorans TaxID=3158560 RepID=UPI00339968CD
MTVDTRHETQAAGTHAAPAASASPIAAPAPGALMTAVVQHRYGGSEVLASEPIAVPAPGAGQVLLKVRAAGLDRGTWHLMAGKPFLTRFMFGFRRPKDPVPGLDVAGTVVALGDGVTDFAIGDEVFGVAKGSFAEFAVAPATKLVRRPEQLAPEAAAAVPVSGMTALQAVVDEGRVRPGQRVLVTGASGGVGNYAVQIAVASGAEVTGVASAGKVGFLRSLGATRTIDYRATDVTTLDERFDLIIDINGRKPVRRLQRVLAPEGTLVMVGGEDGDWFMGGFQRQLSAPLRDRFTKQRILGLMSAERAESLERLAAMIVAGQVRPQVSEAYPLADVRRAMDDLVGGRVSGKAVITVAG